MDILITGANGGLGSFLKNKLNRKNQIYSFDRKSSLSDFKKKEFDIIIHCAARIEHMTWGNISYDFIYDNVLLTHEISKINSKKIIYISSIDSNQDTPYGVCKNLSEKIISSQNKQFCIIRPSGLIGRGMKENTFMKIIKNNPIALSKESILDFTLYQDVLNVINQDLTGIINLTSNKPIKIGEIVEMLKRKNVTFGNIDFKINYIKSDFDTKMTSKEKILHIEKELM